MAKLIFVDDADPATLEAGSERNHGALGSEKRGQIVFGENRRAFLWALIVVLVVVTIIPILFQDQEDAWRKIVQEFQTLITGVFAVLVAALTVIEMQAVDRKAGQRHEQAMRINVRAEKLKVERMLLPQFAQLRVHYKELRDASTGAVNVYAIQGEDEEAHSTMLRLADWLIEVKGDCLAVQEIIDRHHWVAAGDLFGGALRYDEEQLREALSEAPRFFQRLKDFTSEQVEPRYEREPWRMYTDLRERRQVILDTAAKVSSIRNSLERMFPHLYDLADLYQIKL